MPILKNFARARSVHGSPFMHTFKLSLSFSSKMGSMKSTSKRVVELRVKLGFAVLASSEVDVAAGFVVGT